MKVKNLKTTITNTLYISTAEVTRELPVGTFTNYETFAWQYDHITKQKGKWVLEEYYNTKEEALEYHENLVNDWGK